MRINIREDTAALTRLLDRVRTAMQDSDGLAAEELAVRVLDAAWTEEGGYEALYPAVLGFVRDAERARVRLAEREVFQAGDKAEYLNPAQESMRRLLKEKVYVPGEGMVAWGEMTPEHHRTRVAFIEQRVISYAQGQAELIHRHNVAADLLDDHKCATLNEYAARYGEVPEEVGTAGH